LKRKSLAYPIVGIVLYCKVQGAKRANWYLRANRPASV